MVARRVEQVQPWCILIYYVYLKTKIIFNANYNWKSRGMFYSKVLINREAVAIMPDSGWRKNSDIKQITTCSQNREASNWQRHCHGNPFLILKPSTHIVWRKTAIHYNIPKSAAVDEFDALISRIHLNEEYFGNLTIIENFANIKQRIDLKNERGFSTFFLFPFLIFVIKCVLNY